MRFFIKKAIVPLLTLLALCAGGAMVRCSLLPNAATEPPDCAQVSLGSSGGKPGSLVRKGDWTIATLFPTSPAQPVPGAAKYAAAGFKEARVMVLNGLYAQKRLAEAGNIEFYCAMAASNARSFSGKQLDSWDVLATSMAGYISLELVYAGTLTRSGAFVEGDILVKPGTNIVIVCYIDNSDKIFWASGAIYIHEARVIKSLVPGDTTDLCDGWQGVVSQNPLTGQADTAIWEDMRYGSSLPDTPAQYALPKIGPIGYSMANADAACARFADSIKNLVSGTMAMTRIPAKGQQFLFGSVSVSFSRDFLIGTTEVTQAMYRTVTGQDPSANKGDLFPVETITWYDAVRFCNALSSKNNLQPCYDTIAWLCDIGKNGYRLPTEAEWLFASEAGNQTKYFWGETMDGRYLWYGDNSGMVSHEVATRLPNNFGLFDMAGNVWEWCNDWSGGRPAQGTIDWTGPASGTNKALRGGCFGNYNNGIQDGTQCFSISFVYGEAPAVANGLKGFRCVRTVVDPVVNPLARSLIARRAYPFSTEYSAIPPRHSSMEHGTIASILKVVAH
jgi:hypothetical protein